MRIPRLVDRIAAKEIRDPVKEARFFENKREQGSLARVYEGRERISKLGRGQRCGE